MARRHADDVLYRAVIPSHIPDRPDVLGPYTAQHTAQAQITRRRRGGHVEVGRVVWRPVGEDSEPEVTMTKAEYLRIIGAVP